MRQLGGPWLRGSFGKLLIEDLRHGGHGKPGRCLEGLWLRGSFGELLPEYLRHRGHGKLDRFLESLRLLGSMPYPLGHVVFDHHVRIFVHEARDFPQTLDDELIAGKCAEVALLKRL